MDGFGDDFVPKENVDVPKENVDVPKENVEADPAAEFLAREQNDLAGLDDDIAAAPEDTSSPTPVVVNGGSENELSGNEAAPIGNQSNYEIPELTNGRETDEFDLETLKREGTPSPVPVREEPEKIRIWREEQQTRLQEKDIDEEKEKEELREKAKKELEDWYKQHEEQVTKTRQANRSAEKDLVADTTQMEPGTEWERIAKLCDFNPKTAKSSRDISRMRSIILQVKQNPPVKA